MADEHDIFTLISFTSLKRVDSTIVSFGDTAVCDNIKIVSADISELLVKPPYYGDKVNIRFWGTLGLKIGSVSAPVYPLHAGWKYIYNRESDTFRISDENNVTIFLTDKIKSIADFHVDFNVIKNHQFIIIVGTGDSSIAFMKPVTAKYIGDTLDTYNIQKMQVGIPEKYRICYEYDISPYRKYDTAEVVSYLMAWETSTLSISCMFKVNNLANIPKTHIVNADDIDDYLNSTYLNIDNGKVIIANHSMNFFPNLLPIVNSYENNNNRPTYEPWMIWGLYDFIYPKHWDDGEDDFVLEIFDLSPNWGY